jgi:penicillin-binding protein 2
LGIDLAGERAGLMPTKEWKQKVLSEQWYLGDDYHLGIGQGYLLTTPLQVNSWTQAIANEGLLYQPHLRKDMKSRVLSSHLLTIDNFDLIRKGMIGACSLGGVAWPLFNFSVTNPKLFIDGKNFLPDPQATTSGKQDNTRQVIIACKTGTAQHGTEEVLPHAWITLFVPAYNPQIIVTILVESSGEGSNIAGPIAKKILTAYFTQ